MITAFNMFIVVDQKNKTQTEEVYCPFTLRESNDHEQVKRACKTPKGFMVLGSLPLLGHSCGCLYFPVNCRKLSVDAFFLPQASHEIDGSIKKSRHFSILEEFKLSRKFVRFTTNASWESAMALTRTISLENDGDGYSKPQSRPTR